MEQVDKLLEKIDDELKEQLSSKRYQHSVGVMKKAKQLAIFYGEDESKATLVGLAHDIAKELSCEEKLKYVAEHQLPIDEVEKINVGLLHAKIGADICKNRYGFTKEMQEAILYHATGHIGMSKLAKIILVADKTEEGRAYPDLEKAKEFALLDLDAACLSIVDNSLKKTIEKGSLIHPDSIYFRNQLITSLIK